ncbi:MAG: DUF1015 domain-containing protein, partial [Myxococcales bacterium]|nr:DUF1015 domain-containing protein [Myxococcales bacterium]
MAKLRPFRGLRYDLPRAGDPANLLAPPYDVVDDDGRAELASRSPHNCIHVILPEGAGDSRYEVGAGHFARLKREALRRDLEPSVYVYHQAFTAEGQTHVRKGFVALVELTPFGQGPVLPHERTLKGPKEDRLKLMRACDAHLELVFGLFSDPKRQWEQIVDASLGAPVLEAEFDGSRHTLYRVFEPGAVAALCALLADKRVYMADGHHRYETMCTFADELAAGGHPDPRFGMIYLSNLDDPGLIVLPTHRLVHGLASLDVAGTLAALEPWFTRTREPLPGDALALRKRLEDAGASGASFALAVPGEGSMEVLTLRADFDPIAAGLGDVPAALQRLDVALLHDLVLDRGLGITRAIQEAKTNIHYYKSTAKALEVARAGGDDTQLVCFMNATPV